MTKPVSIITLFPEDLDFTGKVISDKIDQADLAYIATKLSNAITECCYWISLRAILEDLKLL